MGNSKTAIQFGAGNIGRGFIGALLSQAGYSVIFADVNKEIIGKINEDKCYTIHVFDAEKRTEKIENISGMDSTSDDIIGEIANASIVTTAVGLNILKRIAPTIAKGIALKFKNGNKEHLNLIACENAIRGTSQLKEAVYQELSAEEKAFADEFVGFADCSVDRIVPPVTTECIIDVVVENYYEWNVEGKGLKGDVPKINGMNLVDNLDSYIERKLFTLNTGHAICAYLGYKKGLSTIDESIADPAIYEVVKAAMTESGDGLSKKYGLDFEEHKKYIDKIINRFKNPHLKDDVARVGREPMRKLSATDRLTSPLMNTIKYGNPGDNLIKGLATALHYKNDQDPESVTLQELITSKGVEEAVKEVTKISDADVLARIKTQYDAIK